MVVGGHTNTLLYTGENPLGETPRDNYPTDVLQPSGRRVPVVQTSGYGKYLGYLKLSFDPEVIIVLLAYHVGNELFVKYLRVFYSGRIFFSGKGELVSYKGNPMVLDSSIPEDQPLKEIVGLYREEVHEKMGVEVGEALDFINGGRPLCRWEECAVGDLVTDAMAKEMEVDIALINSGAIKDSFLKGTN